MIQMFLLTIITHFFSEHWKRIASIIAVLLLIASIIVYIVSCIIRIPSSIWLFILPTLYTKLNKPTVIALPNPGSKLFLQPQDNLIIAPNILNRLLELDKFPAHDLRLFQLQPTPIAQLLPELQDDLLIPPHCLIHLDKLGVDPIQRLLNLQPVVIIPHP